MPTKLTHINLLNTFLYSFWIIIFIIFVVALIEYPGNGFVYVLFSLLANILLYAGFRKNAIFFDTFIGIFFWLGFWLKLTIRVAFLESEFRYPIYRYFDGSGESFDHALIVSSCAFLGLLLSSFIRERFIFVYPFKSDGKGNEGLFGFYTKYRKHIIISFVILFIIVAITNLFLGIYQRGSVPRTILPFGINGIYKWMLLFGLATASAIILRFESRINNQMTYFPIILAFSENFISNVSMFSRGMILNSSALLFGLYKNAKLDSIKIKSYYFIVSLLILFILFGLSFTLVNHVRQIIHGNDSSSYTDFFDETKVAKTLKKYVSGKRRLFIIDRWVGIYGVIAVSSYPEKGWDLWKEAWKENYTDYGTSFYDLNLISSPYVTKDLTKYHFVSLPGIVAFCFYPGSYIFLFFCMIIAGSFAALAEIFVYKLGGRNVILCALLAQVIAYRYAHFGYVPKQSYILFSALFMNVFIIYFSNKILLYLNKGDMHSEARKVIDEI